MLSAESEVDFEDVYPCNAESGGGEIFLLISYMNDNFCIGLLQLTLSFLNDPSTIVIGTKKFLQNSSSWSELFQLCDMEYSDVLGKTNKDIISKDRHQDYCKYQ